MGNFDLSTLDKSMASKIETLFSGGAPKEGDFLADESIDSVSIEYSSIYQPTTTSVEPTGLFEGMQLGDIYNSRRGIIGDTIEVIPIAMWNSRSYFDRESQEQKCRSPNGITPIDPKFATKCANCRFSKYSKGKPSLCARSLNVLVIPKDFSMRPFVLQFSKTAYKTGLDLARQTRSGKNIYSNIFKIKSERAPKAAYYRLAIKSVEPTPEKLQKPMKVIVGHYIEVISSTINRHEVDETSGEIGAPDNIE
tara:strand:- start:310 stop:1062 length:753 start_codon:yes stop_codon:yes gene_type:complete